MLCLKFLKHMREKDKSIVNLVLHFAATILTGPTHPLLELFVKLLTMSADVKVRESFSLLSSSNILSIKEASFLSLNEKVNLPP